MNLFGNKKIVVDYYVYTNKGDREINEDSCNVFSQNDMYCCVLCDGLGGHDKGEVASQTVLKIFEDGFKMHQLKDNSKAFLENSFNIGQEELIKEQKIQRNRFGMKTTAVSLLIKKQKVIWGHVGDSRLYAFKNNEVKIRTKDHSVPQVLCNAGDIKESDIRFHPDRNKLIRVMGATWEKPMYEISEEKKIKHFNAFLLCTDGFWELITEEEMCGLLKESSTPKVWIENMVKVIEKVGDNKNKDNFSAIGVFINGQ